MCALPSYRSQFSSLDFHMAQYGGQTNEPTQPNRHGRDHHHHHQRLLVWRLFSLKLTDRLLALCSYLMRTTTKASLLRATARLELHGTKFVSRPYTTSERLPPPEPVSHPGVVCCTRLVKSNKFCASGRVPSLCCFRWQTESRSPALPPIQ